MALSFWLLVRGIADTLISTGPPWPHPTTSRRSLTFSDLFLAKSSNLIRVYGWAKQLSQVPCTSSRIPQLAQGVAVGPALATPTPTPQPQLVDRVPTTLLASRKRAIKITLLGLRSLPSNVPLQQLRPSPTQHPPPQPFPVSDHSDPTRQPNIEIAIPQTYVVIVALPSLIPEAVP